MEKDDLLRYVAPCSMLCYTCLSFMDGGFSKYGPQFEAYCEGVCEFFAHVSNMTEEEEERHYSFFNEFNNTLDKLCGGSCHGCRNNMKLKSQCLEGCVVPDCVIEHGVNFCGECNEFPCQKAKEFFNTVNDKIETIWENGSSRIKEIGGNDYFEEKKGVSHYLHFKDK